MTKIINIVSNMAVEEAKPEKKVKTDFEKLKEVFKTLSISDINPIALASINSIRDIGEFVEAIGKLEKKNKEAYDHISQLGQRPETVLMSLIDKVPEDKLKPLIEFSLRMVAIQTELMDFNNLTADQKIELGGELKKVAIDITKIIGELPQ